MKLYKNVNITELESILKRGILSINKLGLSHEKWEFENRTKNTLSKSVYLFNPTSNYNSFTRYGLALVEIEVDTAYLNRNPNETHYVLDAKGYDEYLVKEVKPEQITNIYIPEIFKDRLNNLKSDKIKYCDIKFEIFDKFGKNGEPIYKKATEKDIEKLAKYTDIEHSHDDKYLRVFENNILLFDAKYFTYKI